MDATMPVPRYVWYTGLLASFTTALSEYKVSQSHFRVLCSVYHNGSTSAGTSTSTSTTSSSSAAQRHETEVAPLPPQQPPTSLIVLDSSFNPPTLAHKRMVISALADVPASTNSRVLLLLAIRNADKAPKPADFPQRLAMMYLFAQDLVEETASIRGGSADGNGPGTGSTAVDIGVTIEPYFHSKSAAIAKSDFYQGAGGSSDNVRETVSSCNGGRGAILPEKPGGSKCVMEQTYLTGFDTLIRILDPKYYPGERGSMASALDPLFARSRLQVTTRTDAEWGSAADQEQYLERLRNSEYSGDGPRPEWTERIRLVEGKKSGSDESAVVSSTLVREAIKAYNWGELEGLVSRRVADWIRQERLYQDD